MSDGPDADPAPEPKPGAGALTAETVQRSYVDIVAPRIGNISRANFRRGSVSGQRIRSSLGVVVVVFLVAVAICVIVALIMGATAPDTRWHRAASHASSSPSSARAIEQRQ